MSREEQMVLCETFHQPLNQKIDALSADTKRIIAMLEQHETYLFRGNGTPPLTTRMDRLEQHAAATRKAVWGVIVGAATAAGAWIWERVKS